MYYYNTVTDEYPRYAGDLELLGWIAEETLPEGWVEVQDTDYPSVASDEAIELAHPIQDSDGVWKGVWTVRKLTDEEKQANRIAFIRLKVSSGQFISQEEAALLVTP